MRKLITLAALAVLASVSVVFADDATTSSGVPSTTGGGAPAGDIAEVECNILLGLKLSKEGTADLKAVTFQIPAGNPGRYDVYYPVFGGYEQILRIGGDIAKVQICETPLGQMIDVVTNFNDKGVGRAFLPANVGDGFQILLVDGSHAFHTGLYTGEESAIDFGQ